MPTRPHLPTPATPALLLLGLLALLVWGQCSFSMNGSSKPRHDFGLGVASTDSLTTSPTSPPTLYVTVNLINGMRSPQRVYAARGQLFFNSQHWSFLTTAGKGRNLVVPAGEQRPLQVAIVLVPYDSLRQLRTALAIGSNDENSLRLDLSVSHSEKHDTRPSRGIQSQYFLPPLAPKR